MKNLILKGLVSLITLSSIYASKTYVVSNAQKLRSLGNIELGAIVTVEFNRDLLLWENHDGTLEDDLFFQNGQRVKEKDLNKSEVHCKIDTDSSDQFPNKESIKKDERRVIKRTEEFVNFRTKSYSIRLDLSFHEGDFVDDLECTSPLSFNRDMNLGDLKRAMDDVITIKGHSLERHYQ